MRQMLFLIVAVSCLGFSQVALSAWPLGEPRVDIRRDGDNVHLTTRYTKQSDRAYFKIFVQRGDDIYVVWRSFKNDGQIMSRKLNEEDAAYVREHLSEYLFPADTQFTITTPSGTITLSQQGDRWVERPVRGSSSSSGADEEPQDDDPVSSSSGGCRGQNCVPICQLTGTCGSSSGSGSGSSGGGSSSSSSSGGSGSSGSSSSGSTSSSSTSSSSGSSGGSSGGGVCSAPKDWFLNPFNKDSAHHRPIGTGAEYADDDHPMTRAWRAKGFGNVNAGVPWGKSIFLASTEDPVKTVQDGCGSDGGGDLPITTRIPALAQAINGECGTDGVIAIYDPLTKIGTEIRSWAWNSGNPRGSSGFQNSWTGLGHPLPGERRIASSASGTSTVFGIIRGHEVNTPGMPIEHVLQMSMDRFGTDALLGDKFVWPAAGTDGSCTTGRKEDGVPDCSGPIPYGQLFAIPQNINVEALPLSEPGRRLARALQRYGARPNDGTGTSVNMRADQAVTPEVRAQLQQDMRSHLYPLLRAVLNDAKDQEASGGGTPIAPNCAVDAP